LAAASAASTGMPISASGASTTWPAAWSLIIVDGAIEQVPEALAASLEENGRLITGLDDRGVTRLAMGRKAAGQVVLAPLAEIGIPVLGALAAAKRWSF